VNFDSGFLLLCCECGLVNSRCSVVIVVDFTWVSSVHFPTRLVYKLLVASDSIAGGAAEKVSAYRWQCLAIKWTGY